MHLRIDGAATAVALTLVVLLPVGVSHAEPSREVQAEARAIEAEIRAFQQGQAVERQQAIQENLEFIRRRVKRLDECLAGGAHGDYVEVVYIEYKGVRYEDCSWSSHTDFEQSLVTDVVFGTMSASQVEGRLMDREGRSALDIQKLQEKRAREIAEFNSELGALNELRSGRTAGAATSAAAGACTLPGVWHNHVEGVGDSTWTIDAQGRAEESGMGGVTGSAALSGTTLMITWSAPNGYAGTYSIQFDEGCRHGTGTAVQTRTPPGIAARNGAATFTR